MVTQSVNTFSKDAALAEKRILGNKSLNGLLKEILVVQTREIVKSVYFMQQLTNFCILLHSFLAVSMTAKMLICPRVTLWRRYLG